MRDDNRGDDAFGWFLTIASFVGIGWLFLHDMPFTIEWVTSKTFWTGIGISSLLALCFKWAEGGSK